MELSLFAPCMSSNTYTELKIASVLEIINKPLLLHLVGYLYNCIRAARSQKHPICQSAIFWQYYELTLFSKLVR